VVHIISVQDIGFDEQLKCLHKTPLALNVQGYSKERFYSFLNEFPIVIFGRYLIADLSHHGRLEQIPGIITLQQLHKGHKKLIDILLHQRVYFNISVELDGFYELGWIYCVLYAEAHRSH
jgi:hypothetical protein